MITRRAKSNFFLFFVVTIAVIFYFYNVSQNKGSINIEKDQTNQIKNNNLVDENVTKFTNVEYKTSDNEGREYITKGDEAYLNNDKRKT